MSPKVQLFSFNQDYLRRLAADDTPTWAHFVAYFTQSLRPKLRKSLHSPEDIADVLQDTFARVTANIRSGEIREPAALGAYVHSTCKNVVLEFYRKRDRYQQVDIDSLDLLDEDGDVENKMFQEEKKHLVRSVLMELSPRDRCLLRSCYLDEEHKDQICGRFGVEREYLRVLLLRARESFRDEWKALEKKGQKGRGRAAD